METAQKRETDLDVLPLRDFGIKEWESEGREVVLGTLLKLLVKDKLLHSGKVSVNTELRPLRREKQRTEVQQYGTLNEAMKMWWNNYTGLPHIYFPVHSFFHACPFIARERLDSTYSRYMVKGFRLSIAQKHFQRCDVMCTDYITHPCGILPVAQAHPKMPCIYTS